MGLNKLTDKELARIRELEGYEPFVAEDFKDSELYHPMDLIDIIKAWFIIASLGVTCVFLLSL